MREKEERVRVLHEGRKGGVRLLIQTESVSSHKCFVSPDIDRPNFVKKGRSSKFHELLITLKKSLKDK